ncbi:MAG: small ribosomal subunit Rsm22 family protein [Oscillospiraceae bacterium]|jgi:ribosomal protein RSM22 (predicted rRNA methylase)|nr:small ribosomal subunit Rsm22 family protein [Oscillospiraceae bacterium]
MELPFALQQALAAHVAGAKQGKLLRAAQALSQRYRARDAQGAAYIRTPEDALAYAAARMPATYGAARQALSWVLSALPESVAMRTLLDMGAGTGAATWAALELLPIESALCVEASDAMRALGQGLLGARAAWEKGDLTNWTAKARYDCVTACYVINELPEGRQLPAAEALWRATDGLLLLVEPGTPEGFALLKRIRERLLSQGARVLAPCPQEGACPLPEGDWCHFTCRVARSRLHRLAKQGEAPYEDEKFAYLALGREAAAPPAARVLRHPYRGKGFLRLEVCASDGLSQRVLTKKDGARYQAAKKLQCGDGVSE